MRNLTVSFRQKVIDACSSHLDARILDLRTQLNELLSGAENDSKSSAGDKHETARAMMQREHEGLSRQLEGFLKEKNELAQLQHSHNSTISAGSLIRTNHGIIFLAISIGKVTVDSTDIMTLSVRSPLGNKLLGLSNGMSTDMNDVRYTVEEVI